jgi:hypothetical protein
VRTNNEREQDALVVGEAVRAHEAPSLIYVGTVEEVCRHTFEDGETRILGYRVRMTGSLRRGEQKFFTRMDLFRPTELELRELKEEVQTDITRAQWLLEELTEELLTLGDGSRTNCPGCGEAWNVDDSDAKHPDEYCSEGCEFSDRQAMDSRG